MFARLVVAAGSLRSSEELNTIVPGCSSGGAMLVLSEVDGCDESSPIHILLAFMVHFE